MWMKVLLVGGFGFIGRRFIRKFSNNHQIIVYARKTEILNASKSLDLKKIIHEEGSIETFGKDVIQRHKPDVVILLAALTGLQKCLDNHKMAFSVNVYGTFNVINSCIGTGTKLIFLSSREVYGETIGNKSKENDQLLPDNIYGLTKMIGENLVNSYSSKYGLDYTILRLTNVYGPEGDKYGAQIIIKDIIRNGQAQILGGSQRLNFVYVDDVVDLIESVFDNASSSKQTINVGSNDTITIKEFADKVFDTIGKKSQFEYLPMRKTETQNFEPDLQKMQSILGNHIKTPLKEGIEKTIKWYS
jgi:UDP-glucose 4-epimerase